MRALVRYFVQCLFVIVPALCHGQSGTLYFDIYWEKTDEKKAKYVRTYEMGADHKFKVEDRFIESKNLQMAGYYSSLDSDGIKDGHFIYYTDSGFITKEGNYENGEKTGEWKYYYTNSKAIKRIEHFINGVPTAEAVSYYENGNVKDRTIYGKKDNSFIFTSYDETGKEIKQNNYTEVMPKPPYDLNRYLSENMRYPRKAQRNRISGQVVVRFAVNADGKISEAKVIKHVSPELDEEALRVISEMPEWIPGMQNGKPVKVYFTQPLNFSL